MSATHMMGGVAAAASYLLIVSPDIPSVPMTAAALGIGAIGGLIPDIDHPSSKISRSLRPVNALVSLVFSHRGFFHTPILYALLAALWAWKCPAPQYLVWGACLFTGIFSHILLDCLNPGGIPLLFPVSPKRIHLAKIRTGGKGEGVVRVLLGGVTAVLVGLLICRQFGPGPSFILSHLFA